MSTQIGTNIFLFITQIGTNMFYVSPAVQRDQSQRRRQRRRCSITSLGICIRADLFDAYRSTVEIYRFKNVFLQKFSTKNGPPFGGPFCFYASIFYFSLALIVFLSFSQTFTMAKVSSPQYFSRFSRQASSSSSVMFSIAANAAEASVPLCTPSRL